MSGPHRLAVRVYYEDTDLAGIVYYANYLKFMERGRTEALRALSVDQGRIRAETGVVFAVRRVALDYRAPARFDDMLTVETSLARLGGASAELHQAVRRDGTILCDGTVTVVAIGPDGRARRLAPDLRARLAALAPVS